MITQFDMTPNGITNGMSGHHRRMAVEPVFMGKAGDFIENKKLV